MSEYYDDSIYEAVGTGETAQEETHRDIPADMPPVDQPKKPHKKNGGKKGVALALVCALLGGGMGVGGGFLGASLARGGPAPDRRLRRRCVHRHAGSPGNQRAADPADRLLQGAYRR